MTEKLDFRYFGVVPDDQSFMRRVWDALSESTTSQNKAVREADELVEYYAQRWDARRDIRHFFETGGLRQRIEVALLKREAFESLATKHGICSLLLEIFDEFEIYVSQYQKTRQFIKKQRSIASSRRGHFFGSVTARDGEHCRLCESVDDLKLDHIHPVVLGGLSELDNFQILCFSCNSKKGKTERAIQHPQAFYHFCRNRSEALMYLLSGIAYCDAISKYSATPESLAEGHRILRKLDNTISETSRLLNLEDDDELLTKVNKIRAGIEAYLPQIVTVSNGKEKAQQILDNCNTYLNRQT